MIVCICNAVSERDIDTAVANGATSIQALQEQLAISTQCGSCGDCAAACLERALSRQLPANPESGLFEPQPFIA
jgi:bacterioferritin-associated ferredoxin